MQQWVQQSKKAKMTLFFFLFSSFLISKVKNEKGELLWCSEAVS